MNSCRTFLNIIRLFPLIQILLVLTLLSSQGFKGPIHKIALDIRGSVRRFSTHPDQKITLVIIFLFYLSLVWDNSLPTKHLSTNKCILMIRAYAIASDDLSCSNALIRIIDSLFKGSLRTLNLSVMLTLPLDHQFPVWETIT